jgi:hypothetical protein
VADQLATPADLASALQQDLDLSTATLWVEAGTAVVQAAAGGQRIVEVIGAVATVMGSTSSWLDLPQIPVTAVLSVTLDGSTVAAGELTGGGNYRLIGNRLWRGDGWQINRGVPSEVVVTLTHGYPALDQRLQLARSAVIGLAKGAYSNPGGATRITIDDYTEAYEAMTVAMDASKSLKAALRRQYGRRGGHTHVGGI